MLGYGLPNSHRHCRHRHLVCSLAVQSAVLLGRPLMTAKMSLPAIAKGLYTFRVLLMK